MSTTVLMYALLGAGLAYATRGRRRRVGGRVVKAAALGAVVAVAAPRLGVRLPSLPSLPSGRRA